MNERLEAVLARTSRGLVPAATILLVLLLSLVPLNLPYFSQVAPAVTLIAVFYWTIYRPDLLPPVTVFVLGALQDLVVGTPLGMSALVLLLTSGFVSSQRRALLGKSFAIIWLGFAVTALCGALLSWVAASLYFLTMVRIVPVLVQGAVTAALYPLFAWCLSHVHRRLVG
ncbi:MAG: rod shape-determining protein MreD [Alphaproteobacteria bacterium]|nr:rod shape-determining protein MreD [Alphaproteobacteria bacterium]